MNSSPSTPISTFPIQFILSITTPTMQTLEINFQFRFLPQLGTKTGGTPWLHLSLSLPFFLSLSLLFFLSLSRHLPLPLHGFISFFFQVMNGVWTGDSLLHLFNFNCNLGYLPFCPHESLFTNEVI